MGGKGSGRKPKPVEQKIRLGNLGKRALPTAQVIALPVHGAPEPARPLYKYGLELWNRLWRSGAAWLKPSIDGELVLITCELVDERMVLRGRVATNPDSWRDRRGLREIDRQITSLLGDLGFSPTDRQTLGVGEIKQHGISELNQRIAAKRTKSGS